MAPIQQTRPQPRRRTRSSAGSALLGPAVSRSPDLLDEPGLSREPPGTRCCSGGGLPRRAGRAAASASSGSSARWSSAARRPASSRKAVVDLLQTFANQSVAGDRERPPVPAGRRRRARARSGQPAQVAVPGEHVPRAADAAQRDHRLLRDAPGGGRGPRASETFLPDLQRINAAGKHLLGLINDILDLSKIEAGRMDLYLETFEVGQLVRDVEAIVQPLVEKNGNTLVVACPDDIGTMHADQTKVRQTLFNLLSNAAKFTDHGTDHAAARGRGWGRSRTSRSPVPMTGPHLRRLRHRHRDDRGAARAAVRGVLPGRGLHPEQVRRDRAWGWRSAATSAG